jgi:hypothetical protein
MQISAYSILSTQLIIYSKHASTQHAKGNSLEHPAHLPTPLLFLEVFRQILQPLELPQNASLVSTLQRQAACKGIFEAELETKHAARCAALVFSSPTKTRKTTEDQD